MPSLYLYNNLHAGDVLFSRPLYRALAASEAFDLVLAGFRNNAYLLEDLAGPRTRVHVSDYLEQGPTVLYDLRADCPAGHLPISTWLGEYPDTGNHQWRNVTTTFHRQLERHGLHWRLPGDPEAVPMVDFTPRVVSPRVTRPSLYVDNSRTRSGQSQFVFDLDLLARRYPGHRLLCTARPERTHENVVDVSHLDLRDLSAVSDQCEVILGKGSGPFCCTFTETNRHKPRAVCGYHSELSPTFWDYPGNPMRYLHSTAQLVDFLDEHLGARKQNPETCPC